MKKSIIVAILLLILSSCENSKIKRTKGLIVSDYKKTSALLGRDVDVDVEINKNILLVKLNIKSPSFLDTESQKLLLSMIGYDMYGELKDFTSINYTIIDEGFEHEPLNYKVNKNNFLYVYNKLKNNIRFRKIIIYLFNNMTQDEYLYSNYVIKELHKLMPKKFNFNGSFWELLQMYSLNYNNNKSEYINYYYTFSKVITIEDNKFKEQHLDKIEKICQKY